MVAKPLIRAAAMVAAGEAETIATLLEDEWELGVLMDALEKWIDANVGDLRGGHYRADIAFGPREGATGGGPVMERGMIRQLGDLGFEIYFSEYDWRGD